MWRFCFFLRTARVDKGPEGGAKKKNKRWPYLSTEISNGFRVAFPAGAVRVHPLGGNSGEECECNPLPEECWERVRAACAASGGGGVEDPAGVFSVLIMTSHNTRWNARSVAFEAHQQVAWPVEPHLEEEQEGSHEVA